MTNDAHSIVLDFLQKNGYETTASEFKEQLKHKGIETFTPVEITGVNLNDEKSFNPQILLEKFDCGDACEFWRLWNGHVSEKNNVDGVTELQKIEFQLQLYFALFDMIDNNLSSPREGSMNDFKKYLETHGHLFGQLPELLSYFALPYVPNMQSHPTFKKLFEKEWRGNLESDLKVFLNKTFQPKTATITKQSYLQWLLENENNAKVESIGEVLNKETMKKYEESKLRYKNCTKTLNRIKEDYHNLIGIAAELVDSLEQCTMGKLITSEYLVDICDRLFKNSEKIDLSKPGNTGDLVRASLALSAYDSDTSLGEKQELCFSKIKAELLSQSPERSKCLLLQALIWRLTKSSADIRNQAIKTYMMEDVLDCQKNYNDSLVNNIFASNQKMTIEYLSRFINTVASFSIGRSILTQSEQFVSGLVQMMLKTKRDNIISENLLGALQKFSLRRNVQDILINSSVIEWLLEGLDNPEILSEYELEYTIALLMNLCLRCSGKKRCIPRAERVLAILTNLLGFGDPEIKPYINGIFYSILALPSIRAIARESGLKETLNAHKQDGEQNERQISFIITQLHKSESATSDGEIESEGEEEEDEEGDAIETEADKEESLVVSPSEIHGDELLVKYYSSSKQQFDSLQVRKSHSKDGPLTRPVTPATKPVRQPVKKKPVETKEQERPRTRSGKSSERSGSKSYQAKSASKKSSKTYKEAFSSRPKVPRTPESRESSAVTHEPPPLTRSISPTRPLSAKSK